MGLTSDRYRKDSANGDSVDKSENDRMIEKNVTLAAPTGENEQTSYINMLPFLVWVVAISTMVACIGGISFLGYNIAGYAWVIPFIFSLVIFFKEKGKISLPYKIWLPWICVVIGYLIVAEAPNALQRSIMLLCPIFIGITVSKYSVGEEELRGISSLNKYMAISLCVDVSLKTGILLTGALPEITGLAAEVMTSTLFCCLFAASYVFGEKKALAWWTALAFIPVIALTRMGILASGASLPFTFAPMKIGKRFIILGLVALLAVPIFYSERMQNKMFYSGEGVFFEATFDNPNFRNTGRKFMWEAMLYQIENRPWFGHGANSSEQFISALTGGLVHPHNDYLRLRYDYGYFGTAVFIICMVAQILHIFKKARNALGETKILLYAGASSFIAFMLFMYTDNIILYCAFFGNFQFTLIGLAYAAAREDVENYKSSSINGTKG